MIDFYKSFEISIQPSDLLSISHEDKHEEIDFNSLLIQLTETTDENLINDIIGKICLAKDNELASSEESIFNQQVFIDKLKILIQNVIEHDKRSSLERILLFLHKLCSLSSEFLDGFVNSNEFEKIISMLNSNNADLVLKFIIIIEKSFLHASPIIANIIDFNILNSLYQSELEYFVLGVYLFMSNIDENPQICTYFSQLRPNESNLALFSRITSKFMLEMKEFTQEFAECVNSVIILASHAHNYHSIYKLLIAVFKLENKDFSSFIARSIDYAAIFQEYIEMQDEMSIINFHNFFLHVIQTLLCNSLDFGINLDQLATLFCSQAFIDKTVYILENSTFKVKNSILKLIKCLIISIGEEYSPIFIQNNLISYIIDDIETTDSNNLEYIIEVIVYLIRKCPIENQKILYFQFEEKELDKILTSLEFENFNDDSFKYYIIDTISKWRVL
ncbi:armadillo (ARM) repeat-containing protein family, partial [Trichomonas vaginalis G3]